VTADPAGDRMKRVMWIADLTTAIDTAMGKGGYTPKETALVSLGADACLLWVAYHPNDKMALTYTQMLQKHAGIAGIDAAISAPLVAAVTANGTDIDAPSAEFYKAVMAALK
jgi:hypothetical protein